VVVHLEQDPAVGAPRPEDVSLAFGNIVVHLEQDLAAGAPRPEGVSLGIR
jgi:hypothetical protein